MEKTLSQEAGIKELVATLIVAGVLLMVGIVLFAYVKSTLAASGVDIGSTGTATIMVVESTAYGSFKLATIALIVLAAAVIIGILIRAFGA